jgi:hypothetical protein
MRLNEVTPLSSQATACPSGARAQAGQGLNDQREAIREIIAGTAVEPHPCGILTGDDPKAVVLSAPNEGKLRLVKAGWDDATVVLPG